MASSVMEEKKRVCVIHKGKLYDITGFSSQHPGGIEILKKHNGEDVSQLMENTDSVMSGHIHSKSAYRILEKYCIGDASDLNENTHLQKNLEEKDDLVDWSKPLFHQVGFLGENYDKWVHMPVDRHLRLFSYDLFEFFNNSRWWMVPLYWIPIVCYLIKMSYQALDQNTEYIFKMESLQVEGILVTRSCLNFIIIFGILLWSFLEYVIHRWVFHVKPPADYPWLIRLHFLFHGQHHKAPMDKTKLVFPQLPASFLALHVFAFYWLLLPFATSLAIMAGSILGYICYDMTHYYLHHGTPTITYYKSLKRYHMKHHYSDHSVGYGISTKLWDYPFRTTFKKD